MNHRHPPPPCDFLNLLIESLIIFLKLIYSILFIITVNILLEVSLCWESGDPYFCLFTYFDNKQESLLSVQKGCLRNTDAYKIIINVTYNILKVQMNYTVKIMYFPILHSHTHIHTQRNSLIS